jgi:hypothetical protein
MKLKRSNQPLHGLGEHGSLHRKGGLMGVGHHMPQRVESGFDDRKGYPEGPKPPSRDHARRPDKFPGTKGEQHRLDAEQTSRSAQERRNGKNTFPAAKGDSRRREGMEGNGKGSPPPGIGQGMGVRGSPNTHLGTAGRGAPGRIGKSDSYKGKPTPYPEDITHDAFEKLGAS